MLEMAQTRDQEHAAYLAQEAVKSIDAGKREVSNTSSSLLYFFFFLLQQPVMLTRPNVYRSPPNIFVKLLRSPQKTQR